MLRAFRPLSIGFLATVLFLPFPGALAGEEAPPMPESALLTPDEVWAKLQIGNRRFVQGRPMRHDLVGERAALAHEQRPWVIVLGCADSHVTPELLFDQSLGDMFVVRTAGNVADAITIGSIEYAAQGLRPAAIVVLGHERCGAVATAVNGVRTPAPHLEAVVREIEPALAGLRDVVTGDELVRLGVEQNVHRCATHLLEESPMLRSLSERGEIAVLKALYNQDTGEVTRLE